MGKDRFLEHGKDRDLQRTYRGRAERDPDEVPLPRIGPERAVVISSVQRADEDAQDSLTEMGELLRTAGAEVDRTVVQQRPHPDQRAYLGRGKLDEVKELVESTKPDLVAVDGELSPRQQRTLEDRLGVRVVDRTAVILDIFALHATTAEGKLQVELAQLEYSYSRQEGLWQHLERLGGGVGTRGPGETQLESDRRMLRKRMGVLRRRLRDLDRSRGVMRERRLDSGVPRVALTGYTNAGKSSLMNALSGADVEVDDALFETLDPTTRAIEHHGHRVLLSDTVGFIRALPHQLVEAFRSTLDEVRDADLVLHVADASEPEHRRLAQATAVEDVLEEIGAGEIPRLRVLNKVDRLDADQRLAVAAREPEALLTSAVTGEGLEQLRDRLADLARVRLTAVDVVIPWADGALLSEVYRQGHEVREEPTEEGLRVTALLPLAAAARLRTALRGAGG
ncbi:MAG: GTPase HflX [Thermoleophilia bacterium]